MVQMEHMGPFGIIPDHDASHWTIGTIPYHTGQCRTLRDQTNKKGIIAHMLPWQNKHGLQGHTRPCKAIKDHNLPYKATQGYTRSYGIIQNQPKLYGILWDPMRPNRTIRSQAGTRGPYGTILFHTGLYKTLQNRRGPSGTITDHTGPRGTIQDHAWL